MKLLGFRRGVVLVLAIVLLALFLVRPGAQRLRSRIIRSVSLAIGRPVDIGAVKLRFLPQPAFDLENFVVYDDPAFGSEPMVRSSEVNAVLRVTSLLRGRLEIARLDLTEPSLNLVRNCEGRWNVEDLLERAAKTPVAPTGKAKGERRPAFPYIEASRGRVNFKLGPEKKPYALTDSNFAVWQDSENAWGIRLKAQPVRTDFNLSDTGLVKLTGTWQRAWTLRETPLKFDFQWDGAQLGQLTKLASGSDRGWRGAVRINATLAGEPADLGVTTDISVQDFRRYDIVSGGSLRLAAHCNSKYTSLDRSFSSIACSAPVGSGGLSMSGELRGFNSSTYNLTLLAQDVPVQALVDMARQAKKNLPEDLVATGKLDANVRVYREENGPPVWRGGGEILGANLSSPSNKTELALDTIPFSISSSNTQAESKNVRAKKTQADSPPATHVDIGPFDLALGRPHPATVSGWLSGSSYQLSVTGDAQVQQVLRVARISGLPSPNVAAEGAAKLDLRIAGNWAGFSLQKTLGRVQLNDLRAEVRGVNAPVEITSATVLLQADRVEVQNLAASLGESNWRGSLSLPRPCAAPGNCPIHFDLRADQISTVELSRLLNPNARKKPWYRSLSFSAKPGVPYLATIHASGQLKANHVLIGKLSGMNLSANIALDEGQLRVSDLHGDILGGKHEGEWQADFTVKPPVYKGSGTLDHVSLPEVARAMHDGWVTGTASARYRLTSAGLSTRELLDSADATLIIDVHDGSLSHISLASGTGPLQVRRLQAQIILQDGKFKIREGKLESPGSIYQLSGSASLGQILDVKLVRDSSHGFSITGTVAEPRVAPTTQETQAALKQ